MSAEDVRLVYQVRTGEHMAVGHGRILGYIRKSGTRRYEIRRARTSEWLNGFRTQKAAKEALEQEAT